MDLLYSLIAIAVVVILIVLVFFVIRYVRSKPIGTACATSTDCSSGLVCDTTLKVCRAPVGTVCTADDQCTNNAVCISGTCTLKTTPINTQQNIMETNPIVMQPPVNPAPIIMDYTNSDTYISMTSTSSKDLQLSSYFSTSLRTRSGQSSSDRLLDIVGYQDDEVALLSSKEVLYKNKKYKCNVPLSRLESVGKSLYGVCKGKLFALEKKSLKTSKFVWKPVEDMPSNITHTSATRNGSHLWLQTRKTGYLYNCDMKVVDQQKNIDYKRNYGDDCDHYIDSYPSEGCVVIYAGLEQFNKDVPYAVFDSEMDSIIVCTDEEWQRYKDVRLTYKSSYLIERS